MLFGNPKGNSNGFAKIKTNLSAKLVNTPVEVNLTIHELSEIEAVFTTNVPFKVGVLMEFELVKLSEKFGFPFILCGRAGSIVQKNGLYEIQLEFSGLNEKSAAKLRAITIRGKELDERDLNGVPT